MNFEILIIHEPFLQGTCEVPQQIWPDRYTKKNPIILRILLKKFYESSKFNAQNLMTIEFAGG